MQHDDLEEQEQILQKMLDEARLLTTAKSLEAEGAYIQALDFAKDTFGERSTHVATVLFHLSSFHNEQDKPQSARHCFTQMMEIMRW